MGGLRCRSTAGIDPKVNQDECTRYNQAMIQAVEILISSISEEFIQESQESKQNFSMNQNSMSQDHSREIKYTENNLTVF